jgi:hypothetical protein
LREKEMNGAGRGGEANFQFFQAGEDWGGCKYNFRNFHFINQHRMGDSASVDWLMVDDVTWTKA